MKITHMNINSGNYFVGNLIGYIWINKPNDSMHFWIYQIEPGAYLLRGRNGFFKENLSSYIIKLFKENEISIIRLDSPYQYMLINEIKHELISLCFNQLKHENFNVNQVWKI